MTFVFGLAIGAVLGALFFMDRTDDEPVDDGSAAVIAELERRLGERDSRIEDMQSEFERIQGELEEALDGRGEPGQLELALEEAAAKQAEINSLSSELAAALEELSRLQNEQQANDVITPYVLVFQELHGFIQGGYAGGEALAEDPALNDAFDQLEDPELADTVRSAVLESTPEDPEPVFTALQTVLNHMQERFVT